MDDRQWYLLLSGLRVQAEPVDVEDLVWALSEDGRNHKATIMEERKYCIEPAPLSDGLHDQVFATNHVGSPDRALWKPRTMFPRRAPVFQFQINRRSSNLSLPQVIILRKSPHISCLLFPVEGYWEASKRRTPPVGSVRTGTLQGRLVSI